MQIEIDFEVFKALTALRQSEADSYNAVLRRLLNLPIGNALAAFGPNHPVESSATQNALLGLDTKSGRRGIFGPAKTSNALAPEGAVNELVRRYLSGAWFNNVHFPEGSKFRATYKGQTFYAEIKGNQWVGADGILRSSPSEAASAISQTNVNGWRFWHVQMPGDPAWRRLDELKA
jgi:hypothetical protein